MVEVISGYIGMWVMLALLLFGLIAVLVLVSKQPTSYPILTFLISFIVLYFVAVALFMRNPDDDNGWSWLSLVAICIPLSFIGLVYCLFREWRKTRSTPSLLAFATFVLLAIIFVARSMLSTF